MEEITPIHIALEKEDLSLEYLDMRDVGDGHMSAVLSALQFQHKLFMREMKSELLPGAISLQDVQVVLDFICGPGSWCMDFSRRYPGKQVYGVDINSTIIEQAQKNAAQADLHELEFLAVDRRRALPFPAHTFDCIHLQNGTSLFTMEQWPDVMAEITRVLKPGGWLNLLDFEMGPASQPAIDRLLTFLGQILARMHRSIEPEGRAPFTGSTLGPQRMAQWHFTDIGYQLYPVDLGGWNNPMGRAYLAWSVMRPEMMVYLAERTGLGTKETLQPLLREVQRELRQIDFCGFGMLLSSFGRKPVP
ncbi:MAG TPA: methyltransferase domain-containing protein [Ktedonobacteraceae bacterium]